jgi:hypothetical protein
MPHMTVSNDCVKIDYAGARAGTCRIEVARPFGFRGQAGFLTCITNASNRSHKDGRLLPDRYRQADPATPECHFGQSRCTFLQTLDMAFFTLQALSVVVIFADWCKIRPPFRGRDRALSSTAAWYGKRRRMTVPEAVASASRGPKECRPMQHGGCKSKTRKGHDYAFLGR